MQVQDEINEIATAGFYIEGIFLFGMITGMALITAVVEWRTGFFNTLFSFLITEIKKIIFQKND